MWLSWSHDCCNRQRSMSETPHPLLFLQDNGSCIHQVVHPPLQLSLIPQQPPLCTFVFLIPASAYISLLWCCEWVWWVVPSCVTLHKVCADVVTRTVWFAATATQRGPRISHKVVTSPASNDQRGILIVREEGGKVRYHWAAPVWACCCNNHTQAVTGCSRQSISL